MNLERINRLLAWPWFPAVVLAIATLCVWGHTVGFEFVWDDHWFVSNQQNIRSFQNFWGIFYRLDAQSSLPDGFVLFRPVRTAHYALLYFLGGQATPQPWIYHLANVLWHGAVAVMLFSVLNRLLPRLQPALTPLESRLASLLIALAFDVHPVVSEVVCWVKSLDDILAAFFTLAALRELLPKSAPATGAVPVTPVPCRSAALWRALIYFALAIYSKESAVPFAVVPFFVFKRLCRLSWREATLRATPFFILVAVYMVNRHLVIGRTSQASPLSGTYGQTLLDMLPVANHYFGLLWGIPPFYIDYSFLTGGYHVLSVKVLLGFALLMALIISGWIAGHRQSGRLFGAGLAWTGLFLLPVSNLIPTMQYMAERFLYLPLMGWLAAVGAVVLLLPKRNFFLCAAGVLIGFWGITAWNRSWIWSDELTLFVRSSQEGPITPRIQQNAVAAILHLPHMQQFFSATNTVPDTQTLAPPDAAARARVLATLEMARHLYPDDPNILFYYGLIFAMGGEPQKGLPWLEKASQRDPDNLEYLMNLARAGMDANDLPVASNAVNKAFTLAPTNSAVLKLQVSYLCLKDDFPTARIVLRRLTEIEPTEDNFRWLTNVEARINQPPR